MHFEPGGGSFCDNPASMNRRAVPQLSGNELSLGMRWRQSSSLAGLTHRMTLQFLREGWGLLAFKLARAGTKAMSGRFVGKQNRTWGDHLMKKII
jgi:hypothetical protein